MPPFAWFSKYTLSRFNRLCNLKPVDNRRVVFIWILFKSFALNATEKAIINDAAYTVYSNVVCDCDNKSSIINISEACFENVSKVERCTRKCKENTNFSSETTMKKSFDNSKKITNKPEFVVNPVNLLTGKQNKIPAIQNQLSATHNLFSARHSNWHVQNQLFHPHVMLYRSFSDTAVIQQTCSSNVQFHRDTRWTDDSQDLPRRFQDGFISKGGKSKG